MNFKEDLGKALGLLTYKLRIVQELKPRHLLKRRDVGEWAQKKLRWTKLSKLRCYSVIRLILV